MKAVIFDLDETVIDSSHRAPLRKDGTVDLELWYSSNTFEKVMNDKPLPLVKLWHDAISAGHMVVVCTSRVMNGPDFAMLRKHGLFAHRILHRETEKNRIPDHVLKPIQLRQLLIEESITEAVMYDDKITIRRAVAKLGIDTIDPVPYNEQNK